MSTTTTTTRSIARAPIKNRKFNEGSEQKMCENQFAIREAQGALFASCTKLEDCKAWAECAVPAFWKAK